MGAKVYCVCNQKGGVGKTVTSVNLGIGLARLGGKVLLVDMDSQGSLTASLGYQQTGQIEITLADALKGIIEDEHLPCGIGILHHGEGIDLLPADIELSGMEVTLANVMSRETVLKRYLETIHGDYEIIIL